MFNWEKNIMRGIFRNQRYLIATQLEEHLVVKIGINNPIKGSASWITDYERFQYTLHNPFSKHDFNAKSAEVFTARKWILYGYDILTPKIKVLFDILKLQSLILAKHFLFQIVLRFLGKIRISFYIFWMPYQNPSWCLWQTNIPT